MIDAGRREICRKNGAWEIRLAQSDAERALMWKGRKAAFASVGRISPNYIVQDGVIPRTALPEDSERDRAARGASRELRVANVFHAGDGNLHPLVLYDRRIPGQEKAAEALSLRILELCIEKGGSITGEHGVGEEKKIMMGKMFSEPDLAAMQRVRCAFDPLQLGESHKGVPAHPALRRQDRANTRPIPWKPRASRSASEDAHRQRVGSQDFRDEAAWRARSRSGARAPRQHAQILSPACPPGWSWSREASRNFPPCCGCE